MKTSASHPPVTRFGVFELDLRSKELRKQGMKIRLQGQPVEILAMLLERPGETVTREELQKRLWPADTFVDFEQGLNNAMKRLRAALDDNAESPHFIETLPRRGYRFIGAVQQFPRAATPGLEKLADVGALGIAPLPAKARWQRRSRAGLGIAAVALLAILAAAGWFYGRSGRGGEIESLAVLPLENLSHDSEQDYFADGVTEELIADLSKISALRVISRTSTMQYKGAHSQFRRLRRN